MTYNVPVLPNISGITGSGFTVNINPDGNPGGTFYAVKLVSNSGTQYINSAGLTQFSLIYTNLLSFPVTNIVPNIQYLVSVSAAQDNLGNMASAFGNALSVVPTSTVTTVIPSMFSPRQQLIIDKARELMPYDFSNNIKDEVILAYVDVILMDINVWPPLTGFTIDSVPDNVLPLLYFGVQIFSAIFMQMRATLEDFTYNDNGLSVQVDQVGKIDPVYKNLLEMYRLQITNFKKTQIFAVGGKGLGTPRYQSQIGQFLKMALGSAFTWNQ